MLRPAANQLLSAFFVAGCAATSTPDSAPGDAASGARSLIDAVDFAVWDRYLGQPTSIEPALGIDNDPRGVYSIVTLEGEPTIAISGEVWGSLISKREFCNFRLTAEFKWGTAVWPPLNLKDSGIMFLSKGPLGAVNAGGDALSDPIGSGGFMVAPEYQIAAGDVGSLYNLGPVAFDSESFGDHVDEPGVWNAIELSLEDGQATLSLNGNETVRASGFVLEWPGQTPSALRCGKLQLQSEGAEIFFRRVEIEPLP
jgi:hypothetical protein